MAIGTLMGKRGEIEVYKTTPQSATVGLPDVTKAETIAGIHKDAKGRIISIDPSKFPSAPTDKQFLSRLTALERQVDALLPDNLVIMRQAEVDFGALPISNKTFVVIDGNAKATSKVTAQVAYEAPTNKDLDEIEMDSIRINGTATSGLISLYMESTDGSYLADRFKVNYSLSI